MDLADDGREQSFEVAGPFGGLTHGMPELRHGTCGIRG